MDLSKTPYLGSWRSWVWADLVGCNLQRAHLHLWLCQTTTVFWTDRSEDRQPSVMQEFYYKPRKVKSLYFQICFHHWFTTILLTFVCRIVCKRNLVVRRFQNHFSPERQERFSVRGGEKKGCAGGAIRLGKFDSNLPATSPFMVR